MDPFYSGATDYMAGTSSAGYGFAAPPDPVFSMNNNRFRPVSRRLGASGLRDLRDVDGRRARARSHSNDQQKYSSTSIDLDAAGEYEILTLFYLLFSRVGQSNDDAGKWTRTRLFLCELSRLFKRQSFTNTRARHLTCTNTRHSQK